MSDPTHAVLALATRLARRAAHARELGFDGAAADIEEAIARLNYHDRRVTELLDANNNEVERRRAAETLAPIALQPDDVIVLRVSEILSKAAEERVRASVARIFGADRRIMLLSAGMKLDIVRAAQIIDGAHPVDLLLFCPRCLAQHIDAPEAATGWTNPPHRSHLCHACGHVWRVSDRCTNGVAAIATRGEKDGSAHPCLSWEAAVAAEAEARRRHLMPEPEFSAIEIAGGAIVTSGIAPDMASADSFTGGPLVSMPMVSTPSPGFGEDAADISFNPDLPSHDAAPDALQPSDASAPAASAAGDRPMSSPAAPPAATQPEPSSMHELLHRIRMESGPREQPACFTIPDRPLQPGAYGKAGAIRGDDPDVKTAPPLNHARA